MEYEMSHSSRTAISEVFIPSGVPNVRVVLFFIVNIVLCVECSIVI
jgi:hypothetical protein